MYGFQGILNAACENSNLDYSFTVNLYNEGLDINDIRSALQNNGEKIQKLSIKFQIPNPDDDTLKKIHINPEETINNFKSANLSTKHVTYQAFSNSSLNISSDLIEQELQSIDNLHSSINAKKATQNGY